MAVSREELEEWVEDFTEAFNRENIDEVMAYFADDAIYDEFHGERHVGKAAIRTAFEPQFKGKYGRMRFHTEDMFLDVETGKAMISWLLTLESGGARRRLARTRPAAFPQRQAGRETHLRQDSAPLDREEGRLGNGPPSDPGKLTTLPARAAQRPSAPDRKATIASSVPAGSSRCGKWSMPANRRASAWGTARAMFSSCSATP